MSNIKKTCQAAINTPASSSRIFDVLSDHEGTPNWVDKVDYVKLIQEGSHSTNGVGAIREVKFKPKFWTVIREQILTYTPTKGYQYQIVEGMPGLVNHLGHWKIEEVLNGQTKVTWKVDFEFKRWHWFAPFVGNFAKTFNQVQQEALASLADYLK